MKCLACGSENVKRYWTPCEQAKESTKDFHTEDYYGDGSAYVRIGVHYDAYQCLDCGDLDAEPCIHD